MDINPTASGSDYGVPRASAGPLHAPSAGRTTGRRAPRPADEHGRIRQFADLFAQEPELIQACLQNMERDTYVTAHLILEAAQVALLEHPAFADLLYYASLAAIEAGKLDAAATMLERALRFNPGYKDALILAGQVAVLRAQPQEAKALLETALSAGADFPDVHILLGNLWRQLGNWKRARAAYERALELNAGLSTARAALAALPATDARGTNNELPA